MAGRLKYLHIIRQVHLIASIILLVFLFIYLLTGMVLVNRNLFENPQATESFSKRTAEKKMAGTAEEYSLHLKEHFGFKGREFQRQEKNGNWVFQFNFQGENHQVTVTPAQDTLYIRSTTREMNLLGFSEKIHHLRGFTGGWEYTLWAVFYDLSAVSLIVFAVTGVLFWLKLKTKYVHGLAFLIAGLVLPAVFICLFLFWR